MGLIWVLFVVLVFITLLALIKSLAAKNSASIPTLCQLGQIWHTLNPANTPNVIWLNGRSHLLVLCQ